MKDRATEGVADLGPGRWRSRRAKGEPKFRVHRADDTSYTKPSMNKRKRRRR